MLNFWITLAKIRGELMENEEILQKLSNIEKKQDKILSLLTKVAKTLHLLPVTEKEERNIQLLQRSNLDQAAKVSAQLDDMQNKPKENTDNALGVSLFEASTEEIYEDVIGNDVFGK